MYKNKEVAAIIPARKSNDSIDELNLKFLGDKPLIFYTIQSAIDSTLIDKVYLSTEDISIAELAKDYDIEVPFYRPVELTKPSVTAKEVAIYTLREMKDKYDIILILMPNAPFRSFEVIDSGIRHLVDNQLEKLRTVTKIKDYFINEEISQIKLQKDKPEREFPNFSEKTVVAGGMYIYKFERLVSKNDELNFHNFFIPRHESTLIKSLYDLLIAERLVNLNSNLIKTLTDST